jgi:predicted DNA-binding transcriptional regulator AlpA
MKQSEHPDRVFVRSSFPMARYEWSRTTLWRRVKDKTFPAPRFLPGGQRRWVLAEIMAWEVEHLTPEAKQ